MPPKASEDTDSDDEDYKPTGNESTSDSDAPTGNDEHAVEQDNAVVPDGEASQEVTDDLDVDDDDTAGEEDEDEDEDDGDYDDGMEEDDSTASGANVRRPVSIQEFLAWRLLGRVPTSMRGCDDARRRYVTYEESVPQSLTRGSLWQQLSQATNAAGPARRNSAALFDSCMDASMDSALLSSSSAQYGKQIRQAVKDAVKRDPRVAACATLLGPRRGPSACGSCAVAPPLPPIPGGYLTGCPAVPGPRMVLRREQGEAAGPAGGWSAAQMRHMQCHRAMPRYPRAVVDSMESRAYIGQFSGDGQFFLAAFQDRRVRLYDVERGWRLRKDITTRMCRWTITDTSISPDQRFIIYSSIIPVVHLVEIGSMYDCVSSIANVTQVHEPLNFDDPSNSTGFGIWSVQWSGDGREILAGNNDKSVVVLDVETRRVVARAEGHDDDVNAVTYADSSPNIIVSGSDDTYIKVWDRRTMAGLDSSRSASGSAGGTAQRKPRPVGVLVGHTEGLTHLHSRGDGLHVLSNSKDQTAKLWDLRMLEAGGSLRDTPAASRLSRLHVPQFNWDYRWQEYPAAGRVVRHQHDTSVQTYRGHSVQNTLIRAYFSPAHTTGQRFVYTGSVEGGVHVYDVVSGQEVEGSPFRLHRKLVRDVSWHPFESFMATVSWDGTVVRWDAVPPSPGSGAPEVPGHDAFNDYY